MGWRAKAGVSAAAAMLAAAGPACMRLDVKPVEVEVKPIHVTVDVNIKVQKVDRRLEDFFSDVTGTGTNRAPAGEAEGKP